MLKPKKRITSIKPCPCCTGKAVWVDLKGQEVTLWQISCNTCGLSTMPEENRFICLRRWNQRTDRSLKSIWGFILLATIFLMGTSFVLGIAAGTGV